VLYLSVIAAALTATALVVALRRRLLERRDPWTATVLAALAWLAIVGLAYAVLPDGTPPPADYPADVLWGFRVASLGVQAVLWSTIGLVFATIVERVHSAAPAEAQLSSLTG
jgi:predicted cobalt transporter CbtA